MDKFFTSPSSQITRMYLALYGSKLIKLYFPFSSFKEIILFVVLRKQLIFKGLFSPSFSAISSKIIEISEVFSIFNPILKKPV